MYFTENKFKSIVRLWIKNFKNGITLRVQEIDMKITNLCRNTGGQELKVPFQILPWYASESTSEVGIFYKGTIKFANTNSNHKQYMDTMVQGIHSAFWIHRHSFSLYKNLTHVPTHTLISKGILKQIAPNGLKILLLLQNEDHSNLEYLYKWCQMNFGISRTSLAALLGMTASLLEKILFFFGAKCRP